MLDRLLIRPWPTAGHILDFSKSKTYSAIRRGEIPSVVIDDCIRVPLDQLRETIARKASSNTATVDHAVEGSEPGARALVEV